MWAGLHFSRPALSVGFIAVPTDSANKTAASVSSAAGVFSVRSDCSLSLNQIGHVAAPHSPTAKGDPAVGIRARRQDTYASTKWERSARGGGGGGAKSDFHQTAPQFTSLLQTIAERQEVQGEVAR